MCADFVCPSLSRFFTAEKPPKGIDERLDFVRQDGVHCSFVEIGADRTKTDRWRTYRGSKASGTHYIIHTDYEDNGEAAADWTSPHRADKTIELVEMVCSHISTDPPYAVELHSGGVPDGSRSARRQVHHDDLLHAVEKLRGVFGAALRVVFENRPHQRIRDSTSAGEFLVAARSAGTKVELCLDVMQLWTACKAEASRFHSELEACCGLKPEIVHLHGKLRAEDGSARTVAHATPQSIDDKVIWDQTFQLLASTGDRLIVNPEVHSLKALKSTVEFCQARLAAPTGVSGVSETRYSLHSVKDRQSI
jgi:hypothetical protein